MAGPVIGGRRPISWRLAIVVAVVVLFASNAWLKGIFGYGEIATDIPFLLFGLILFFTWRINRNAANRTSELLGSARFGDRADVRKLEANGDLLIGRSATSGKLLRYDGAAHLLTMAPTRSGKGVGTIIPNLLLLDRSVICIDPKGENARVTARARDAKGPVWCLDPFGVSGRTPARYNPLDRLDPTSLDLAEDANTLAGALVHDAPGQSGDAHWNEEAKALIAGLILHTVVHEPADRRRAGDGARQADAGPCRLCRAARRYAGQRWRRRPDRPRRQSPARQVRSRSRRRAVVGATPYPLSRQPAHRRQHRGVGFHVRGIEGRDRHGVPVPAARPARYLCALAPAAGEPGRHRYGAIDRPPSRPVLFLLDEFAALGRLEPVERAMGLMAGYGLQLWPILQDMHQLKANYGERAGTFMSNAGVIQAFGINDHATAELLSKTLGDTTLEYDTVSTSRGIGWGEHRAGPSESVSAHVTARRLATPDEIMRMRPDQLLLLRQGEHPLPVEKIRYYDQREFAGLFDPA